MKIITVKTSDDLRLTHIMLTLVQILLIVCMVTPDFRDAHLFLKVIICVGAIGTGICNFIFFLFAISSYEKCVADFGCLHSNHELTNPDRQKLIHRAYRRYSGNSAKSTCEMCHEKMRCDSERKDYKYGFQCFIEDEVLEEYLKKGE